MEKMVGVKALGADLLLAFQAEKDKISLMERAQVFSWLGFVFRWRLLTRWLSLFKLTYRVLNL